MNIDVKRYFTLSLMAIGLFYVVLTATSPVHSETAWEPLPWPNIPLADRGCLPNPVRIHC